MAENSEFGNLKEELIRYKIEIIDRTATVRMLLKGYLDLKSAILMGR